MHPFVSVRGVAILALTLILPLCAQQVPPSPDQAWPVPQDVRVQAEVARAPALARPTLDPNHVYRLPELVDIAEQNNPETRVIWEQAKQRAAAAGIARSTLFPTVAALASASYSQYSLFVTKFYHEDLATFPATLSVNYTVFDFGARGARIAVRRLNIGIV